MIETSSDPLPNSSDILGNVWKRSCGLRTNFGKVFEIFGSVGYLRSLALNVVMHNKTKNYMVALAFKTYFYTRR